MHSKNGKRALESDSDEFYSDSSETGSDGEWGGPVQKSPKKARKASAPKAPPATPKIPSKASILSLASNEIPGSQSASEKLANIDSAILGKIKKALALGGHQATGEAEAKRAMRLATKLMAQHNVNQADIFAAEEDSEKLKRAGQSTVAIKSTSGKRVLMHSWAMLVANTMTVFFDCKCYSTSFDHRHDWTFYGLSEQTVAAAYAFEMVYNLILVWSGQNKNAKGRTGKNNYCHGVAEGLHSLAKQTRKEEKEQAVKKERERLENACKAENDEHRRAIERLEGQNLQDKQTVHAKVKVEEIPDKDIKVKIEEIPDQEAFTKFNSPMQNYGDPTMETDSSDDDADFGVFADGPDDIEMKADFDDRDCDINQMLQDMEQDFKPVSESTKDSASASCPSVVKTEQYDTLWTSSQQLALFRNNASSIADDFLKQNKIKVRNGRPAGRPQFKTAHDIEVYEQGKKDARKIDVKQKRIKGIDDE